MRLGHVTQSSLLTVWKRNAPSQPDGPLNKPGKYAIRRKNIYIYDCMRNTFLQYSYVEESLPLMPGNSSVSTNNFN